MKQIRPDGSVVEATSGSLCGRRSPGHGVRGIVLNYYWMGHLHFVILRNV